MEEDQNINEIKEMLIQIAEDKTVPKNIRDSAQKSKESLEETAKEINVRVDKATQLLDEISDDPNMPMYTRTQIWSIVSMLESIIQK